MRARALPVLLLLSGLCACGGDDADPATSPSPPPGQALPSADSAAAKAYAQAAEAVCAQAVQAGAAITAPTTPQEYLDAFTQTLQIGKQGQQGLAALTPPPEDAAALRTAFLDPVDKQVAAFEEALPAVRAAVASDDPATALGRIPDPGAAVTVDLEFIERYGMPSCARFAGKS